MRTPPDEGREPQTAVRPAVVLEAVVLGAADPSALAAFYAELLGWPVRYEEPGWVMVRPPQGGCGLSFQEETGHVPPVWPTGPGEQQMQMHLDLWVTDLQDACTRAERLGAVAAASQPQEDVRVYLDPAGHPFCLFEQ